MGIKVSRGGDFSVGKEGMKHQQREALYLSRIRNILHEIGTEIKEKLTPGARKVVNVLVVGTIGFTGSGFFATGANAADAPGVENNVTVTSSNVAAPGQDSEASARSDKVSADSTPTTLFESGESSDQATGIGKTTTIPITESTSSSTTTTSESTSSSTTTIPTTESTSSSTTTIPTTESTSSSTTTTSESISSSTTTTSRPTSSTTTTIYNSPEPQQPSVAVHTPGEAVTGAGSIALAGIGISGLLGGGALAYGYRRRHDNEEFEGSEEEDKSPIAERLDQIQLEIIQKMGRREAKSVLRGLHKVVARANRSYKDPDKFSDNVGEQKAHLKELKKKSLEYRSQLSELENKRDQLESKSKQTEETQSEIARLESQITNIINKLDKASVIEDAHQELYDHYHSLLDILKPKRRTTDGQVPSSAQVPSAPQEAKRPPNTSTEITSAPQEAKRPPNTSTEITSAPQEAKRPPNTSTEITPEAQEIADALAERYDSKMISQY